MDRRDRRNEHCVNITKTDEPFSWRKNTPNERAVMQNERRKRKRKARAANKEHKRKALVALEDERVMTLAKNESLLRLARKYYAKWHVLHLRQRVGTSFDVTFRSHLMSRVKNLVDFKHFPLLQLSHNNVFIYYKDFNNNSSSQQV